MVIGRVMLQPQQLLAVSVLQYYFYFFPPQLARTSYTRRPSGQAKSWSQQVPTLFSPRWSCLRFLCVNINVSYCHRPDHVTCYECACCSAVIHCAGSSTCIFYNISTWRGQPCSSPMRSGYCCSPRALRLTEPCTSTYSSMMRHHITRACLQVWNKTYQVYNTHLVKLVKY